MTATVTAKGQATLPVEVRRRLGLKPGSKLEFMVIDDDRLEAIPVSETVSSLKGMVPKPKKVLSLTDMDKAIVEGVSSSPVRVRGGPRRQDDPGRLLTRQKPFAIFLLIQVPQAPTSPRYSARSQGAWRPL